MTPTTSIPFVGAFESTYQPAHDRDVLETTEHTLRWRSDLALMRACNVDRLRYPVRWHRIERAPGEFDWTETDRVLGHMHDTGMEPIVDLLHHTSYPQWLGDLSSTTFGNAFLRFAEAVAIRYPWLPGYTVCNEPFTTFLMCGQEGLWPPHWTGLEGFARLAANVFPAVTAASRALHDLLPAAQHLHVEAAEHHTASTTPGAAYARLANDRRFLLTDLLVGREIEPARPFATALATVPRGDELLMVEPGHVDIVGLDYYAHNQWHWSGAAVGTNVSPDPKPLSDLIVEYADRYRRPVMLSETNISGFVSDRASWLKYTLEHCEMARDRGVDVQGYCWFPFVDSADWASQLAECEGEIDPVGVFWLDEHLDRRPSTMSAAYMSAAGGSPSRALPAYRFRSPVSDWLQGWHSQMKHWEWQEPFHGETCSSRHAPDTSMGLEVTDVA